MGIFDTIRRLFSSKGEKPSGTFPADPQAPEPPPGPDITDKLRDAAENIGEKAAAAGEVLKDQAGNLWNAAAPLAEEAGEKLQEAWDHVRDKAEEILDKLSEDDPANAPQHTEPEITPDTGTDFHSNEQ